MATSGSVSYLNLWFTENALLGYRLCNYNACNIKGTAWRHAIYNYNYILLTLGAHAPEGYGSCPVCVSVRNLNLETGASRGLNEGTSE